MAVLHIQQARVVPVKAYAKTDCDEAVVPEGVEVISPKVFQYCARLRVVRLPRSLTHIELKSFEGCPLEEIYYAGSAAEWERVEISPVKNDALLRAKKHYALPGEIPPRAARPDRSPAIYAHGRELLAGGGDGQLHVFVPELMIPGSYLKYGDLSLIVFPRGSTMMIDAGRDESCLRAQEFMDRIGLQSLDCLSFSHGCADHVTGGAPLIRSIWAHGGEVRRIWWTGQAYGKEIPRMFAMLAERGAETDDGVRAGRSFDIDGVRLDILGPTEEELAGDANDGAIRNGQSMVMHFTHGAASLLTSGDLYFAHERAVVARCGGALRATVMKANHHGGYTSTSPEWLDAVQPRLAYACSNDNGCLRVEEEMRARGITYVSTGCQGLLHITLRADGSVSCETQYEGMKNIVRING